MVSSRMSYWEKLILFSGILIAFGVLAYAVFIDPLNYPGLKPKYWEYPFYTVLIFTPFYLLYLIIHAYFSSRRPILYLFIHYILVYVALLLLWSLEFFDPQCKETCGLEIIVFGVTIGLPVVIFIPLIAGGAIRFFRRRSIQANEVIS